MKNWMDLNGDGKIDSTEMMLAFHWKEDRYFP